VQVACMHGCYAFDATLGEGCAIGFCTTIGKLIAFLIGVLLSNYNGLQSAYSYWFIGFWQKSVRGTTRCAANGLVTVQAISNRLLVTAGCCWQKPLLVTIGFVIALLLRVVMDAFTHLLVVPPPYANRL